MHPIARIFVLVAALLSACVGVNDRAEALGLIHYGTAVSAPLSASPIVVTGTSTTSFRIPLNYNSLNNYWDAEACGGSTTAAIAGPATAPTYGSGAGGGGGSGHARKYNVPFTPGQTVIVHICTPGVQGDSTWMKDTSGTTIILSANSGSAGGQGGGVDSHANRQVQCAGQGGPVSGTTFNYSDVNTGTGTQHNCTNSIAAAFLSSSVTWGNEVGDVLTAGGNGGAAATGGGGGGGGSGGPEGNGCKGSDGVPNHTGSAASGGGADGLWCGNGATGGDSATLTAYGGYGPYQDPSPVLVKLAQAQPDSCCGAGGSGGYNIAPSSSNPSLNIAYPPGHGGCFVSLTMPAGYGVCAGNGAGPGHQDASNGDAIGGNGLSACSTCWGQGAGGPGGGATTPGTAATGGNGYIIGQYDTVASLVRQSVAFVLPTTTSWTVPANWTAVNKLVCIGGAGTSAKPSGSSGGAGSSGSAGEVDNVDSTHIQPGDMLTVAISAGGDGNPTEWFGRSGEVLLKCPSGINTTTTTGAAAPSDASSPAGLTLAWHQPGCAGSNGASGTNEGGAGGSAVGGPNGACTKGGAAGASTKSSGSGGAPNGGSAGTNGTSPAPAGGAGRTPATMAGGAGAAASRAGNGTNSGGGGAAITATKTNGLSAGGGGSCDVTLDLLHGVCSGSGGGAEGNAAGGTTGGNSGLPGTFGASAGGAGSGSGSLPGNVAPPGQGLLYASYVPST